VNVLLPRGVPEALDMLASDGAAIPIAGGTTCWRTGPARRSARANYVDLSGSTP